MIKVQSLRVDYDDVTAVNDIDIEVAAGEIYGLVGPNGAGKTSTLKALAGLVEPTYGLIEIGGFDLETHQQQALAQIGFMPDFPPLYENLTAYEYLEVFAAAYFIPEEKRPAAIGGWLYRVNLQEKRDAFIHTLSRGMRQRLVLAKTLLHDPMVVILDEPASGLDPISRMEVRGLLKDIAGLGKTIIISSHILTELSDFCTAVGIMEKGKMVVSGTIQEIRNRIDARGELVVKISSEQPSAFTAVKLLNDIPCVSNVREVSGRELRAVFSGTEADAAALLSRLLKEDIRVAQFFIKEADVEDIFFKIGAREVS